MSQQPDKLFKEKLASYEKQAPSGAWDKIEAGLQNKKKGLLWLKIAASILVLMVAGYLLSTGSEELSPLTDAQKSSPESAEGGKVGALAQKRDQTTDSTDTPGKIAVPFPAQEQPLGYTKKGEKQEKEHDQQQKILPPTQKDVSEPEIILKAESDDPLIDSPLYEVPATENLAANENLPTEKDSAIKLVYSPEEANVYLDKKSLAEATLDDKKTSTLKKLLKKAADLKTNQDPFGDLRQMKNEILALNFKQEKQRGQNK